MAMTFPTHNDLPELTRSAVVDLLNANLLDLIDLHSQTKFCHWNVKGPQFIALHKLLDELAEVLEESIDDAAERATALGGVARGTVRQAASGSRVAEYPEGVFKDMELVSALAERYASVAKVTRQSIDDATRAGDADTADLFTEHSRELDKALWFLEAHIQK